MISPIHISNQLSNVERLGLLPTFRQAAIRHRVPVTLLLAIASRESGMGTDPFLLANNWTGRDGHGKGIMQVDDRYHSIMQHTPGDDHITNIEFAAKFLAELMNRFDKKVHSVAAFNAGASGVQRAIQQGINPDSVTTGGNYAQDVFNRERMIAKELGINIQSAGFVQFIPALLLLSGGLGLLIQQLKSN
ncbi:transglycosylase SLT domain-containing protein [Rhodohalobacter barkolensis]|uniref:Transglycosylase SLT domain-containing protein n=1 Tax=Rhodohalobacter barkolensis TaxID=2053187 RepID=A0A2N0VHT2_9BACT|nr:transglycosylase SLT domain-containing protein [Rhodohalobacter barkolensis]PKD43750.1 hypothetical protein CWD77_09330 [Rhodohalobacter barkolensis]